MRILKVGFSRPKDWKLFSQIIQWSEHAPFSHTFLRWSSETLNCELVYQASHGMVHFVSGERFDRENETVIEYCVELTDEQFNAIAKKCIELAGTKYGTLQIIGMALERATKVRNPFRDGPKTFVCSELVGEVLKQIMQIDLDPEYVGPSSLERLLSGFAVFRRVV